ncbi:GntR family transcriptional regulator [Martelella sp. HB161492]|uniref:GntR family transcriptional regulator n=1 Tax=Martelella sp. HB161492 TaxID=2720726 RepID=UPI00158FCDAA|nr:GntR family transcriptional regulator [Martelella sp. HB161492]
MTKEMVSKKDKKKAAPSKKATAPPANKRPTLVEQAVTFLRDEIISGRMEPGQRIHLFETAERLEMSMVPLREALGVLVSEGLVVALRQRGFRVSEIDLSDMEDLYRIRLMLDPLATRLAMPVPSQDDLDAVTTAYQALIAARSTEQIRTANRQFHFAIYRHCRSPWLLRILNLLWDNSERYQVLSAANKSTSAHQSNEHDQIYQAVLKGDPAEAEQNMYLHVLATVETLREGFGSDMADTEETETSQDQGARTE